MRLSIAELANTLARNPDLRASITWESDLTEAARQVSGTSEYALQSKIMAEVAIRALSNPRWRNIAIVPLGQYRPNLRAEPGLRQSAGYPDILVDVQAQGYAGLRVELKTSDGQVAPHQAAWHRRLEENGYRVEVIRTYEDCMALLEEYLNGD